MCFSFMGMLRASVSAVTLCRGLTKFCRKTNWKNLLGLFWCLYCSVLEQCYLVRESLFHVALSAWTSAVFPSPRSILSFCLLLTGTKFKHQHLNIFPVDLMGLMQFIDRSGHKRVGCCLFMATINLAVISIGENSRKIKVECVKLLYV